MNIEQIVLGLVATINVVAFIIMANDKQRSARSGDIERIPEGVLFFLAAAFGSGGIYLAMIFFRHKTKKWYFGLGIPLLILQNLAVLYLLTLYIGN